MNEVEQVKLRGRFLDVLKEEFPDTRIREALGVLMCLTADVAVATGLPRGSFMDIMAIAFDTRVEAPRKIAQA